MWNTTLGRLRIIGIAEGTSFLVLLLIAMPLKYLADQPMAVKIVGSLHGGLFLLYCLALALAARAHSWPPSRSWWGFVASIVPAGTFIFDGSLKREQAALTSK